MTTNISIPLGWDASPLQGYPQHLSHRYPFPPTWEWSILPQNTTKCPQTAQSGVERTDHEATANPPDYIYTYIPWKTWFLHLKWMLSFHEAPVDYWSILGLQAAFSLTSNKIIKNHAKATAWAFLKRLYNLKQSYITLANDKGHRRYNEPIRTQRNYK